MPDDITSPLEAAIGQQTLERYEAGLKGLAPVVGTAVVCRVVLGLSFAEIAELLDKRCADAARMMVARALITLAEEMDQDR